MAECSDSIAFSVSIAVLCQHCCSLSALPSLVHTMRSESLGFAAAASAAGEGGAASAASSAGQHFLLREVCCMRKGVSLK